jgi:hypothetical protein
MQSLWERGGGCERFVLFRLSTACFERAHGRISLRAQPSPYRREGLSHVSLLPIPSKETRLVESDYGRIDWLPHVLKPNRQPMRRRC